MGDGGKDKPQRVSVLMENVPRRNSEARPCAGIILGEQRRSVAHSSPVETHTKLHCVFWTLMRENILENLPAIVLTFC